MPLVIKHAKQLSGITDDADPSTVSPSDWNAAHSLVGEQGVQVVLPGAGGAPTGQTGGRAWRFTESQGLISTASWETLESLALATNSAGITLNLPTAYERFKLFIHRMQLVDQAAGLALELSYDSGATWITTGYRTVGSYHDTVTGTGASRSGHYVNMAGANVPLGAAQGQGGRGYMAEVDLFPGAAGWYPTATFEFGGMFYNATDGYFLRRVDAFTQCTHTAARATNMRLRASSGNIDGIGYQFAGQRGNRGF